MSGHEPGGTSTQNIHHWAQVRYCFVCILCLLFSADGQESNIPKNGFWS